MQNPIPKPEMTTWEEMQALSERDLIAMQKQTMTWQHHEILLRNAEVTRLRDELALLRHEQEQDRLARQLAMQSSSPGYDILVRIANDPQAPIGARLKAAEACLGVERPKLSANMSHVTNVHAGIGDALDRARRLKVAQERGLHVIDGEPAA